jgi:hypothetical protein
VLHQVGVSFDLYYDARKHEIKMRRIVAEFTPRLLDDQKEKLCEDLQDQAGQKLFFHDKTGSESCLYCCDPESYVNSRISQAFKLKTRRGLAAKGIGVPYMLTAGRQEQIRMYKRLGGLL